MSTEPFTDETLSAIIDGDADAEFVASVAADPVARARLAHLQAAVAIVASPPEPATPERRSASIAAAMAAATPAAPEVTSLAAARHARSEAGGSKQIAPWFIAAAAAVLLVVAIPLARSFTGASDTADTAVAETASDAAGDVSLAVDDAMDSMDEADNISGRGLDSVESAQTSPQAATGSAPDVDMASDDSADAADDVADQQMEAVDEVMADSNGDSEDGSSEEVTSVTGELVDEDGNRLRTAVDSVENLNQLVSLGSLTPTYTAADLEAEGVSPACLEQFDVASKPIDDVVFALASLGSGIEEPVLVLVYFDADGTTVALNAEDCSPLG